jgi:hypothetical protein
MVRLLGSRGAQLVDTARRHDVVCALGLRILRTTDMAVETIRGTAMPGTVPEAP